MPQKHNEDPKVDAHAHTPKNLDSADSPSVSPANLGSSHATQIDTTQQPRHHVSHSNSIDGTDTPLEQNSDRPSTSTSTEEIEHTYQLPSGQSPSQVKATASASKATAESDNAELQMFLLKPVISDSSRMIELSWTVRDTNMRLSKIRKQLAKYEQENLPSVLETLETLHSDEHYAIDVHILRCNDSLDESRSQLIALERTKTNTSVRDMVFQGVHGLQFIFQQVRSQNPSVRDGIGASDEWIPNPLRFRPYADDYDHDYSDEDSRPKFGKCAYWSVNPRLFYDPEKEEEAREQYKEKVPLRDAKDAKENEEDELVKSVDEDEVVAELLGKYTTLYAEG